MLEDYQRQFLDFAVQAQVLQFGEFTLKSGRISPYFFNAGLFDSGAGLARLGGFYASALLNSGIEFDLLFGPAYKGIPLVATTAISLATAKGLDIPYAYNRKEAKDHGEGGVLVGAPLTGKVVIVDDVITAGTAIREVMALLANTEAEVTGVIVAIDRQEKGKQSLSAIQEVEQQYGIPVISVVKLSNIIDYLSSVGQFGHELESISRYREEFGVA